MIVVGLQRPPVDSLKHDGSRIRALTLVLVMALTLSACTDTATPTTVDSSSDTSVGDPTIVDGPQIPPVDTCSLLVASDIDEALGLLDLPIGDRGFFSSSRGEACVWEHQLDGVIKTLRVEPADMSDFEPDASLLDVPGVIIEGAGDHAVWFSSVETGALSVVQESPVGFVFVRIVLERPDLTDGNRLDAAKVVAARVIERLTTEPAEPIEVRLCDLVTDADAEELLGPHRLTRPAAGDRFQVIGSTAITDLTRSGEGGCTKLILTEVYVAIQQGAATDFDPGAMLEGVSGEVVSGVGEQAVWFGAVPVAAGPFAAAHETGILSVRQGDAFFRIVLSLPDLDPKAQLQAAIELAMTALERLPGGGLEVTRQIPAPPSVPVDLVENLLAKVDGGVWTLGEGLVATLSLLVGAANATEVLDSGQIAGDMTPQLIDLARAFSDDADQGAVRFEVARLLDLLVLTGDEIEAISGPSTPTSAGLMVSLGSMLAQSQEEVDYCTEVFQTPAPCLVEHTHPELEATWPGKYTLFRPRGELNSGWTLTHVDWVLDAMAESVKIYESLGVMPETGVVLGRHDIGGYFYDPATRPACQVNFSVKDQSLAKDELETLVAYDMARCLLQRTFPITTIEENLVGRWWFRALAVQLGGSVYPIYDHEHAHIAELQAVELTNGLLSRLFSNWIFFEYLHSEVGPMQIMALIGDLPQSFDAFATHWHPFNEKVTDARVADLGKGVNGETYFVPYEPVTPSGAARVEISGVGQHTFDVSSFGVNRFEASVTSGKVACLTYDTNGQITASWRSGQSGKPGGEWSRDLPETLSGESVYLLTAGRTSESGLQPLVSLTIRVNDVVDSASECERTAPPPSLPPCVIECLSTSNFYRYLEQLAGVLRDALSD
jgi:hypothetical protein